MARDLYNEGVDSIGHIYITTGQPAPAYGVACMPGCTPAIVDKTK